MLIQSGTSTVDGSTITVTGFIVTDSNTGSSNGHAGSAVTLTSTGATAIGGAITVSDFVETIGDLGAGAVTITSTGGSIATGAIYAFNADTTGSGATGGNVLIQKRDHYRRGKHDNSKWRHQCSVR